MAAPKLREVRLELQARLGFGAVDNPVITPILNSFINEAQEQLYAVGRYKTLEHDWFFTAATGSANVAYPTDAFGECNPDKIVEVHVNIGSAGAPDYREVKEGITPQFRNQVVASTPWRYERRLDGLEFAPARDKDYPMLIKSMRVLTPLRDDSNTLSIDKKLIFALALAAAKSHYRHPEAQLYLTKAQGILNAAKWDNAGPRVFHPNDNRDDPMPRPVVV